MSLVFFPFIPGPYSGHTTLGQHVSFGSSWMWRFLSWDLSGLFVCFFLWLDWAYGFGEQDHRDKLPLSLHMSKIHSSNGTYPWAPPDHLVFVRFLPPSPLFLYWGLWKAASVPSSKWRAGSCSSSTKAKYLRKLFTVLLHGNSSLFYHLLFTRSIIFYAI